MKSVKNCDSPTDTKVGGGQKRNFASLSSLSGHVILWGCAASTLLLYTKFFLILLSTEPVHVAALPICFLVGFLLATRGLRHLKISPLIPTIALVVAQVTAVYACRWMVLVSFVPQGSLHFSSTLVGLAIGLLHDSTRLRSGRRTILVILAASSLLIWFLPFRVYQQQSQFENLVVGIHDMGDSEPLIETGWRKERWFHQGNRLLSTTVDLSYAIEMAVLAPLSMARKAKDVLIIEDLPGTIQCGLELFGAVERQLVLTSSAETSLFMKRRNMEALGQPASLPQASSAPLRPNLYPAAARVLPFFANLSRAYQSGIGGIGIQDTISFESRFDLIFVGEMPESPPGPPKTEYFQGIELLCEWIGEEGILSVYAGDYHQDLSIVKSLVELFDRAKLHHTVYHGQVPSLGQQSWVLASRSPLPRPSEIKFDSLEFTTPPKWWNREMMQMVFGRGKESFF